VVGTATTSDETSPKSATAACTGGRVAVGGGYVVTAATGSVAEITPTQNFPTSTTVWSTTASEDNDADVGNWSLQAYVLCLTAGA
jgi:hypothetical protein